MKSVGFYAERVHAYKRTFVRSALLLHRGNPGRAARYLGVHRNTMTRLIRELGIQDLRTK